MDLGMGEILLILFVALLVYGGRLPEVARTLGRTISQFKRTLSEASAEVTRAVDDAAGTLDDDEEDDRPRTVRRIRPPAPREPAPTELAAEDVSGGPAAGAGEGSGDGPPPAASDPAGPPA